MSKLKFGQKPIEEFPSPESHRGQAESRTAYQAFFALEEEIPWRRNYETIKATWPQFKNWRVWALIAWLSEPKKTRSPRYLKNFCDEIIQVTENTVRTWRSKSYGGVTIDEAVGLLQAQELFEHRRDVFDALIDSATNPDPKCHRDRRVALEMLGDYTPSKTVTQEIDVRDWLEALRGVEVEPESDEE